MPQMFPMNWIILMLMFIFSLMLIYFFLNSLFKQKLFKKNNYKYFLYFIWKW